MYGRPGLAHLSLIYSEALAKCIVCSYIVVSMSTALLTGSYSRSHMLQVAKFVFPVYYGSRYQCEKVPKHAMMKALKHCSLQVTTEAVSVTAVGTTASAVKASAAPTLRKSS